MASTGETPDSEPSWIELNPGKARIVLVCCALLFAELGLRVVGLVGLAPYTRLPTDPGPAFWDSIDEDTGIWRHPNAVLHHKKRCFDVVYRTNSVGARDRERAPRSGASSRVLFLGASLVEGFGVEREQRFTDLLEARTGIEHLNFGTSGGFSSIQEWLLYQKLADSYDHTHVFVSLVPFNDFAENRVGTYPEEQYRPYLRRIGDGFQLYYTVAFEDRHRADRPTRVQATVNVVFNASYALNTVRWIIDRISTRREAPRIADSYDEYEPEDLAMLLYSYDQIAQLAGDRQVYIFSIPFDGKEFRAVEERGYDFRLVEELTRFAASRPNIVFVDLLPSFIEYAEEHGVHYRDFELGCDAHWGPLGHRAAAEAIYDAVWKGRQESAR